MISNRRKQIDRPPSKLLEGIVQLQHHFKEGDLIRLKEKISERYYRGTKTINGEPVHTIRELLLKIYHGKCAYCEDIELKPEVEHYRPKRAIKEEPDHNGYFWLAYEWSNLLPSCHYCNTSGGKGNQFPIMGVRVTDPVQLDDGSIDTSKNFPWRPPLSLERPFLLNPEIDSPESYFAFDKKGKIIGIDPDNRGKKTIEICNMNRDTLTARRKRLLDVYVNDIRNVLLDYYESENSDFDAKMDDLTRNLIRRFKGFEDKMNEKEPFSLYSRYIRENFQELVVKQFSEASSRGILVLVYQDYFEIA